MSLIDLGNLTEPAKVLIERVSDLIGGALRPHQIRRIAEAEADAKMTVTVADLQAESLRRRTAQRWLAEEEDKQRNMEAITGAAVTLIKSDAEPEKIERDWLVNFFDKSRLTSDEEMQQLWAKILAGEANAPGRFSKRTISAVAVLDKADAARFQTLCRFSWSIESGPGKGLYPLVLVDHAGQLLPLYNNAGVYSVLGFLAEIGLIRVAESGDDSPFDIFPNQFTTFVTRGTRCRYFDRSFEFAADAKRLPVGQVRFTRTGAELAAMSTAEALPAFADGVVHFWSRVAVELVEVRQS